MKCQFEKLDKAYKEGIKAKDEPLASNPYVKRTDVGHCEHAQWIRGRMFARNKAMFGPNKNT